MSKDRTPVMARKAFLATTLGAVAGASLLAPEQAVAGVDSTNPKGHEFDVRKFGAVGDGTSDDTAAFQAALTALLSQTGPKTGVLYVPSGEYRITTRIEGSFDIAHIWIRGDGLGVSRVICSGSNSQGLFRFNSTLRSTTVMVSHLSMIADHANAGTAFEYNHPGPTPTGSTGNQHRRSLVVEHVEVAGLVGDQGHYFNFGFVADRHWRPLFSNVVFAGPYGSGVPDSLIYAATSAFQVNGAYAPAFVNSYAWSVKNAFVMRAGTDETPEGGIFSHCFAVECYYGILVSSGSTEAPRTEPRLVIDGCHINALRKGVEITRRKFVFITNNLFYTVATAATTTDNYYLDVHLIGCNPGVVITNNIIHTPRDDEFPRRRGVYIDGKTKNVIVDNNFFFPTGPNVDFLIIPNPSASQVMQGQNYVA